MNDRLRAWRLLVRILFARETPEEAAALREALAAPSTPWLEIISYANVALVTATLWSMLIRRRVVDCLGDDERQYLEAFHALSRARNTAIKAQLVTCLARLRAAGVPALPIKGASYLLANLHGDIGSRFMSDIDLLVPSQSAPIAREVLLGEGYREVPHLAPLAIDHRHLPPLAHAELPAPIELHTSVVPERLDAALPAPSLWDSARREVDDYLIPSATDAATISFMHTELIDLGTELFLIPLRGFHDLHVLQGAQGAEISWAEVAARAARVGAATRFQRYAHTYRQISGIALLPELRSSMGSALTYRISLAAIAWPVITRWRLRADRLSERKLRRRFRLDGGALEVNIYRMRRAFDMLANALTRRNRK